MFVIFVFAFKFIIFAQTMGLQQHVEKQLGVPLSHIILSYCSDHHHQQSMTILSIFDANSFAKMVLRFLPDIVSIPQSLKHIGSHGHHNYNRVWMILISAANQLGINTQNYQQPSKSFLGKSKIEFEEQIIDSVTWEYLRTLSDLLLQTIVKNQNVLYAITTMDQKYQIQIKQYLQAHETFSSKMVELDSPNIKKNSSKNSFTHIAHNDTQLIEKVEELENIIIAKQAQLTATKSKLNEFKEQLILTKSILQQKQVQIHQLKGRIQAYAQTDLLFQEKDEEIAKINAQLAQIKLKTHVKQNQLTNQVNKYKSQNKQLQSDKADLTLMNQQLLAKIELLSGSKEEVQKSNKIVIANLKQKIKVLNERLAEQQKNMMDVLMEKQQKDKQIFQLQKKTHTFQGTKSKLTTKHDQMKNSARKSIKLMDQLGDLSHLPINSANQAKFRQYFLALFGDVQQKCTKQLCITLRQQYVRIVQKILQISNDSEFLTYITSANRLECIVNGLTKIQQTCQENLKLKQKIVLLQTEGGKGNMNKQAMEQINKLKKKLLVMKRNMEETEAKRKQQLQILVGVMAQHYTFDIKS